MMWASFIFFGGVDNFFFPMVKWPVSVAAEWADGESEGESIVVLATIVTAQIPITVIPIPDEGLYRVAGTTVLRL